MPGTAPHEKTQDLTIMRGKKKSNTVHNNTQDTNMSYGITDVYNTSAAFFFFFIFKELLPKTPLPNSS